MESQLQKKNVCSLGAFVCTKLCDIILQKFVTCHRFGDMFQIRDPATSCNFNFLRSLVAQETLAAGWFAQMPEAARNIILNQKLAPGGDVVSLFAECGRPGFKDTLLTLFGSFSY